MTAEALWRVVCTAVPDAAEAGLARQQALAEDIAGASSTPVLLIWRSQPALLVTRTDALLPRFEQAAQAAQEAGWPVLIRRSGGSACPVAPGTAQVATIMPASPGSAIEAHYDRLSQFIGRALRDFGVASGIGRVAEAFCQGRYDIGVAGRKIAGLSQRWFRNSRGVYCAVTAASINVTEDPPALAEAVNRFYEAAGGDARCRADAITCLRLCDGAGGRAERDLMASFIKRLAAGGLPRPAAAPTSGAGGLAIGPFAA